MSLDGINTYLTTKLGTLTATGQKFEVVYPSMEETVTGFPAILFEASSYESSIFTTTDNLRKYKFRILFMTEMENKTRSEALAILYPAIDDAIAVLESDYSLGGNVDFCNNNTGEVVVESGANGAIIYMEMMLTCTKEVSTTT